MNTIDSIAIVISLISMFIGYRRGVLRELLSLLIWIVAFWVARTFHDSIAISLSAYIQNTVLSLLISYALLFIAVFFIGFFINLFISTLINASRFSISNQLLGALFGLIRAVFILLISVFISKMTGLFQDIWLFESWTIHYLEKLTQLISNHIDLSVLSNQINHIKNELL